MPPLVSIIIPHYSRPGLLGVTVASVKASSDPSFELIIVDDGSPDQDWQAVRLLEGDRTRVLQRSDGTKGPSRCRNIGLAAAQGEYVIFLDSDDLIAPWCIAQRLLEVTRSPGADLWVFPVLLFREAPGDLDLLWNSMTDGRDDACRFARSDPPWHTSSSLWRTSALRALGGFNEAVFYGDDSELHLRALITGLKVVKLPDALPDMFVRRSDEPRITNSLTAALIESRRTRLREGSRMLGNCQQGAPYLAAWEGQYFVEAEFLLFNHMPARLPVRHVLGDWKSEHSPSRLRRILVQGYFAIALACRKRAYLLLRISRRIAMRLLPAEFFPRGGSFHAAVVPQDVLARVRELLGQQRTT